VTRGSLLVKVTSHDTAALAVTEKVVLLVVSIASAAEAALVSVFEYSWALTAAPELAPRSPPVHRTTPATPAR
jgi:hypothetical protein